MKKEFWGFQRDNGAVGVRNYIGIISAMDNVNPIARKIAENVKGTVLISDLFGRKMMGTNHEMRVKAFTGLAGNPNLTGVIVVSLHRPSAASLAEPIAALETTEILAAPPVLSPAMAVDASIKKSPTPELTKNAAKITNTAINVAETPRGMVNSPSVLK